MLRQPADRVAFAVENGDVDLDEFDTRRKTRRRSRLLLMACARQRHDRQWQHNDGYCNAQYRLDGRMLHRGCSVRNRVRLVVGKLTFTQKLSDPQPRCVAAFYRRTPN